jgi:NAD-dependent DNA ligase
LSRQVRELPERNGSWNSGLFGLLLPYRRQAAGITFELDRVVYTMNDLEWEERVGLVSRTLRGAIARRNPRKMSFRRTRS